MSSVTYQQDAIQNAVFDPTTNSNKSTLSTGLNKTDDAVTVYPAGVNCTVVDLATDADVTVTPSPAHLLGVEVTVAMSAHAALVKDGSTTKHTLAASTAAGYKKECYGELFATSIVIESDNSGTGTLEVYWLAV